MISLKNIGNFLLILGSVLVFFSFTDIAYSVHSTNSDFLLWGFGVFVAGFVVRVFLSLRGDFLMGKSKSALFWLGVVGNSLLLFGLVLTLFTLFGAHRSSLLIPATLFLVGLGMRIFVAIRRIHSTEDLAKEYAFWRNSLIFSLPVWLGVVWLVGFGLSGSIYSNSQRSLESSIISLPLLVAVICLLLGVVLKTKGKIAPAIKILIAPIVWAVLSILLIVYLTYTGVFI